MINNKITTLISIALSGFAIITGLWYIVTTEPDTADRQTRQAEPKPYYNQENNAQDIQIIPEPETEANVLLIGFDERGLGDAIIIVSYNLETFESTLISIKRDTYVDFQTWSEAGHGHSALAWAAYVGTGYGGEDYLQGAKQMAETVEELLGIEINSYAGITFTDLIVLVDLIDGVTVDVAPGFAERSEDPLTPGRQHLTGEEALIFARHRSNPRIPEPGSLSTDGDRIRRHHQLLKAMFLQLGTLSANELLELLEKADQKIHTNMDYWEMLFFASVFYEQDPSLTETAVLPGELKTVYEDHLDQELEYFFLDLAECNKLLRDLGVK